MKLIGLLIPIFFIASVQAQPKVPALDKSPMDMSYYPDGYPVQKTQDKITQPPIARVIYGRPQKNGRVIFGELVEYGKVWRLGANEATEIEFYQNVKVNNTSIKKGRYTLYAIPNTDKWTMIINKENDTWGAFKYDIKKDIVRVDLPVQIQPAVVEALSMFFEKTNNGANLIIAWDNVKVSLPFIF